MSFILQTRKDFHRYLQTADDLVGELNAIPQDALW